MTYDACQDALQESYSKVAVLRRALLVIGEVSLEGRIGEVISSIAPVLIIVDMHGKYNRNDEES